VKKTTGQYGILQNSVTTEILCLGLQFDIPQKTVVPRSTSHCSCMSASSWSPIGFYRNT